MKKYLLVIGILILVCQAIFAQPRPKPKTAKTQPSQPDMNKLMEDAMKDMNPAEKAEMKKMMGGMMPALMEHNAKTADYPAFTNNKELLPKKSVVKLNNLLKKKLSSLEVAPYAGNLYTKLITNGDPAEIAIIKSIIAKAPTAAQLESAAILCMLQGHPQAAMAIAAKSVQADAGNLNGQNNLASLLTQYGHPEKAIPLLNKLADDAPSNSTVLNNMAYAWLGLGETDSARFYSGRAIRMNPGNPEATLCGGLMEELYGDPTKANDMYVESMESNLNPFTEKLLINNNGQDKIEKIDFNKIKKSITIYEYFPKNWIKIPDFSDKVDGYENDMRISNSYGEMLEKLDDKITALKDEAGSELDSAMEKGENQFADTMQNEMINGLNMMSKSAVMVQKILYYYLEQWNEEKGKQAEAMQKDIEKQREIRDRSGNDDKCPDYDQRNNEFLQYANPRVRMFHAQRIEEFRMWLNAFCTWSWYVVGNPKNAVRTECIGFTNAFRSLYSDALSAQEAIAKTCVSQKNDDKIEVAMPEVPKFTCPVKVNIPSGPDWIQLSNATKDFDNNVYGIKKTNKAIPNVSVSYAMGNIIGQPGHDPFIKTADGNVTAGMINETGPDELAPLTKIIPLEHNNMPPVTTHDTPGNTPPVATHDASWLRPSVADLLKRSLEKKLLDKYMTVNCKFNGPPKKWRFEVGMGSFELFDIGPQVVSQEDMEGGWTSYLYDDGTTKVCDQDGNLMFAFNFELFEVDPAKPSVKTTPEPAAPVDKSIGDIINQMKKSYDDGGLVPSLSSGLQAVGAYDFLKNVFN